MFDRNRDGTIQYSEFLHLLRGELNDFRRDLVERAFIVLDKNNNGVIEASDIKQVFNAKRHPDVLAGRKSEHTVLQEFIDTFEQHVHLNCQRDGRISLPEFIEYYTNISISIDRDEQFN
mmetsp:Transcript_17840/g.12798  ORF Transcript_17840/g.12798 Transcript_17840/m.12798 type:complete len:119 (-) Transcript_17840:1154-1510(-)